MVFSDDAVLEGATPQERYQEGQIGAAIPRKTQLVPPKEAAPAEEPAPAKVPTNEVAPIAEPTEEPAVTKAPTSEPPGESAMPCVV